MALGAKHTTSVSIHYQRVTTPRSMRVYTTHTTTAHSTSYIALPAAAGTLLNVGFKTAHPVLILPPRVVEALHFYWCAAAAAAEIFVCVSRVACGCLFRIPPGLGLPNAVTRRGFHCGHGRKDSHYFHSSSNGHTTIGSVSVANQGDMIGADLRIYVLKIIKI